MASKLLHTLADENLDLQKNIGCMNGIFQIFDRYHVLTSRRKSLTSGNAHVYNITFERDSAFQFQDSNILNNGSATNEKLARVSTESSRVSFSSSCSSSSLLSSELNREAQPEISAYDRVIFPGSPTNDPVMSQRNGFASHMGLDLRDVVRDSMYREVRELSEVCKHKRGEDSSRPYGLKHSTPVDFNESCKALAKLWTTSQHCYNEVDMKDASRYYVDSHNKLKTGKKLKESPRLWLDSRDHVDLKSGNSKLSDSSSRSSSMNKVSGSPKRPPSVVAKLMGLETLPGSPLGRDKSNMFDGNNDPFSRSLLREHSVNRTIRFSPSSPRSLGKDQASSSPRWRSSEFVMKPLSSLRFPTEPAPWKQTDRNLIKQKQQACKPVKALSHSGKELRALNEISEANQPKSVFGSRKQPQYSNSRGLQNQVLPPTMRGPIVIMKPARLVENSGVPSSSLIPIHSLSGLSTTCREEDSVHVKRNSTSKKLNGRSSQVSKESIPKNLEATRPRLREMKKHENEKRSRPPTTPSDSSKSRRQTNRQPEESTTSPGGRRRPRAQRSTETEATMIKKQATKACDGKSPSVVEAAKNVVSNLMQNKSSPKFSEDGSSEHPSPVSVLNASIYREIKPSPVKMQASEGGNGLMDSSDEHCEEDQWNPAYSFSETTTSFSPEINRKKLQNVEHLVQKLKRLNTSHDETSQDYIASLCENNDPNNDHRYISEILLASGLLLRDLGSELTTFQLHPSGHPINPELFLVLEQTRRSNSSSNEKLNRKLVFDAVNEMLVKKLAFEDPWMKRKVLSAQELLKELCSEIETVKKQAKKRSDNFLLLLEDQEEDFLKCILDEDITTRPEKWTEFDDVVPGLVLDLERLLFKDLVSEVVHGEIATSCRRLVTDS